MPVKSFNPRITPTCFLSSLKNLQHVCARCCSMILVLWCEFVRYMVSLFARFIRSTHAPSVGLCWITHMLLDTIALDSALMLCLNCVIVFVIILFGLLVLFMLFKECKNIYWFVMKSFILTTVLKLWKGNSHTYSWIMWRGTLDMYVLIVRSNIKHIHHIRDIEHLSPCN